MERMGSNMNNLNRRDQSYLDSVIKKKSQNDPKEVTIREKIERLMTKEAWSVEAIIQAGDVQKAYLIDAIANASDESYVHERTQTVLRELSELMRSQIVEGGELLDTLPAGSPVLVATNHFGAYKLLGVSPRDDLGVDIPNYDAMYPYPMYFAALYPVANRIKDNLYYASEDFPLVFGEVHTKAGFVHIPPASVEIEGGRTAFLINETREVIEKHPNSAIVNFPEGGTSGKYSDKGPYDLDPFKTGAYVIAGQLGIHIVPVAQYFDPHSGFRLKVLKPFVPPVAAKEELEKLAEANRNEMQAWFDQQSGTKSGQTLAELGT